MSEGLLRLACVALAGALGAVARWGVSVGTQQFWNARGLAAWPVGTLTANTLGCFAFGLCYAWMEDAWPDADQLRSFIFTGFLGAFTTFSTFAFDTYSLQSGRGAAAALLNIGLHVGLGLLAVWLGFAWGRE